MPDPIFSIFSDPDPIFSDPIFWSHLPHVGKSQFFKGHNFFGVKFLGHAGSLNAESDARKSRRR